MRIRLSDAPAAAAPSRTTNTSQRAAGAPDAPPANPSAAEGAAQAAHTSGCRAGKGQPASNDREPEDNEDMGLAVACRSRIFEEPS